MQNEYLSTGFTDVDRTRNRNAYFDCLRLLDSLPYYQEYKTKSYDLLDLKPGMTILEAGCGLGDDAFRMAGRIMPGGKVIGLDASEAMIAKAKLNANAALLPVQFLVGDVKALPFPDGSIARCRIDRVLQHIPQPEQAIAELFRVLEPGGLLLAYDNDWEAFSIASSASNITPVIERLWRDSFVNSAIGRHLPGHFMTAGLSDIKIYPSTSVITDFETADKVYNLQETAQKAMAAGFFSEAEGHRWIKDCIEQSAKGHFKTALTAYTVIGKKEVS
ncbi:MAG: methyltransferase domain-containing protein [Deltaproteobacteria bacterium]